MTTKAHLPRPLSTLILLVAIISVFSMGKAQQTDAWLTDYEQSGYVASPRFDATLRYLRRLDRASAWVQLSSFGSTPQGRALPLVILSRYGDFSPKAAHRRKHPVILIQSGIHAGEIDGKDASLMLIRDIAIRKTCQQLAENATLLFIPIFNLDGHERQSRYNRINQNGPEEMGWRVTANNLNLNRDFMKADAPEMRAWLNVFKEWMPDMVIDIHVTDGIDFQYNLTYSMEMNANAPARVVRWQKDMEQSFIAGMRALGDPVCPYVFPREDRDLSKGLLSYAAPPRFSTGYAAIRNRAALLVETHMLKPYRERVTATYRLLREVLSFINNAPLALRAAVAQSDSETVEMFASKDSVRFPLQFKGNDERSSIEFLGYASAAEKSELSGGDYPSWDHSKPVTVSLPYFNSVSPSNIVTAPKMYLVPQEWTKVVDVLKAHGIRLWRLTREQRIPVQTLVFSKPKWREAPYEGRHPLEFQSSTRNDTVLYPVGTYLVPLDQPAAKAAVHLLEPTGPDSFVSWGFFDAIFEQKEYYEEYVMEEIARNMLKSDPELKAGFEQKLAADTAFIKNPRARLNYFFERSPYVDKKLNVYPVGRVMSIVRIDGKAEVTASLRSRKK